MSGVRAGRGAAAWSRSVAVRDSMNAPNGASISVVLFDEPVDTTPFTEDTAVGLQASRSWLACSKGR